MQSSASLLKELASFLSTFQTDLSGVSSHISSLQDRSKAIERRLAARAAVEQKLAPVLDELLIQPRLVDAIFEAPIDQSIVAHVEELDSKLARIRSGPRVEQRRQLDAAAEALRLKAVSRIQAHFVELVKPYGTSILPVSALHDALRPLQPLFFFLRRHAARQAHELQKAYASTLRWYYETSFRRYVRSLESARLQSLEKVTLVGDPPSVDTLAVLSRKSRSTTEATAHAFAYSLQDAQIDGQPPLTTSSLSSAKPSAAALFRSLLLVLLRNANDEAEFVDDFFQARRASSSLTNGHGSVSTMRDLSINLDDSESDAGKTSLTINESLREEREERAQAETLKRFFHELFDPALEYAQVRRIGLSFFDSVPDEREQNFIGAILAAPIRPTTLFAMIRLTNAALAEATTHLEPFLMRIRMLLWPALTKSLESNGESLKRLVSASASSRVKDSHVVTCAQRYASLMGALIALSLSNVSGRSQEREASDGSDMLWNATKRIRNELDKLLVHQANKMPADKRSAFLRAQYDEVVRAVKAASDSALTRAAQDEVDHYVELTKRLP